MLKIGVFVEFLRFFDDFQHFLNFFYQLRALTGQFKNAKKMGWKKIQKMLKIIKKTLKFNKNTNFQHFFTNFFDFFSTHFFGIFELRWQCSKFWLRWINFIFSKWLSYSRFTKSVLPSSQVENVTAYHPSTIYFHANS